MIGMRGKRYWLVMVVDGYWFVGELRFYKLVGMMLGRVVFVGYFVR